MILWLRGPGWFWHAYPAALRMGQHPRSLCGRVARRLTCRWAVLQDPPGVLHECPDCAGLELALRAGRADRWRHTQEG